MQVLLFGASGMIGRGVLLECLDAADVTNVLSIGRSSAEVENPKLAEIVQPDLFDVAAYADRLGGFDACFFCLGISSAGMSEADYTKITYDLTISVAEAVLAKSSGAVFCFISGQGTDSTEHGRSMWARVKGKAENRLAKMPFRAVYSFRPGIVRPRRGVASKTFLYRAGYAVFTPLFPIVAWLLPGFVTTSDNIGRAMLNAVRNGPPSGVLENPGINALAGAS